MTLLYVWGAFHLFNAVYGLTQGRIAFLVPQRSIPIPRWVGRDEAAVLFYLVVATNAVFGAFLIGFAWTSSH